MSFWFLGYFNVHFTIFGHFIDETISQLIDTNKSCGTKKKIYFDSIRTMMTVAKSSTKCEQCGRHAES